MHVVPGWPTATDTTEPAATLSVKGVARDAASVTVVRSIPDPIDARPGLIASTATIEWADRDDAHTGQESPWTPGAVPAPGDLATVEVGYKGAQARVLTGVVDHSTGTVPGPMSSELMDDFTRLNRPVTLPPLMATMPPYADGGAFRRIGITPTHFPDRLLRTCGYYATPRARPGTVVSVPLMGSAWPEFGDLRSASMSGDATAQPTWAAVPWGQAARGLIAQYTPTSFHPVNSDFEITVCVGPAGTSGSSRVVAYWGTQFVRVLVGSTRTVQLAGFIGGVTTTVASLTAAQMAGATVVRARWTPAGSWSLTTDTGVAVSGTLAVPGAWVDTVPDTVEVSVPSNTTPLGGLLVGFYGAADVPPPFERTAHLTPAAFPATLGASPAIVRRRVSDVLREQAQAELASFWIDDVGHVQWRNRDEMVNGSPVRDLTAEDSLISLGWELGSDSVVSSVTVTNRAPRTSAAVRANITVWEGRGESLESGQTLQEVIHPPADEDWVMVNDNLNAATPTAPDLGGFHRGRRSWFGGVRVSDGTTADVWVSTSDIPLTQLDPRSYQYLYTAPTMPAETVMQMRVSKDDTTIWAQWRNHNLPIVRAYGRVAWADEQFTSAIVGPSTAPEFVHDAGWWVQHPTARQSLATYIAQRRTAPLPRIRALSVVPDARLERGDIVTVSDPSVAGIWLRCLVLGITIQAAEGQQTMTLDVTVLEASQRTYDALAARWAGQDYDALAAAWAGLDYDDMNTDPLGP
jgi:hypothetical protein